MAAPDDVAALTALLGREPQAEFDVVVRDAAGAPVVVRNAPFTRDGTPMPTRYWLVDPALNLQVSRLEAAGGVREAQAAVDPPRRCGPPTTPTRPSATPRSRRATPARGPRVASAAPGRASSACTPTTPTSSPAATTPSAAGRTTTCTAVACREAGRGGRHRHQLRAPPRRRGRRRVAARRQGRRPRPADAHHPPRAGRRPRPRARARGDRAHDDGVCASTATRSPSTASPRCAPPRRARRATRPTATSSSPPRATRSA